MKAVAANRSATTRPIDQMGLVTEKWSFDNETVSTPDRPAMAGAVATAIRRLGWHGVGPGCVVSAGPEPRAAEPLRGAPSLAATSRWRQGPAPTFAIL